MFVGSYRPEYHGRLREVSETTIVLAPLDHATTMALIAGLIGQRPTAADLAEHIAQPAAGNPFFVEEIVRDLVGRGLLLGNRGAYRLSGDLATFAVPATVQSALSARIDRLTIPEKSILNAAAVIGSTFDLDVLHALLPAAESGHLHHLISAELIDQIQFLPEARYAFRHPLVRAVAYESQLTTTRAEGHRRLAAAIETRNPSAADENSGLIAHHLEAAGEIAASYTWYMRSADWLTHRDINAARDCWERARAIADKLPDQEGVTSKRIAPRAQLMFTPWLIGGTADDERCFEELRELTMQSGDLLPLAIGMSGRVTSLIITDGRVREASAMAGELMGLFDKVGGTAPERAEMLLAVALAHYNACEFEQALRTTDRLREMAAGLTAGELAPATAAAGAIKIMTGRRAEGRRDLQAALQLAQTDALLYAIAVSYKADPVVLGFELADEALVKETRKAVRAAESFGDAYGLAIARWAHGTALLHTGDRTAGIKVLNQSRADGIDLGGSLHCADVAVEMARQGRRDEAIDTLQAVTRTEIDAGDILFVGYSLAALVQLLAGRGARDDVGQARDLVEQYESELRSVSEPSLQLWPLRCRAFLANAVGDGAGYAKFVTQYRDLAEELDARGHLAIANQLLAASAAG